MGAAGQHAAQGIAAGGHRVQQPQGQSAIPGHWPGKINEGLGRAMYSLPDAERNSCDYVIDANVLSKESAQEWLKACMASQEEKVVS